MFWLELAVALIVGAFWGLSIREKKDKQLAFEREREQKANEFAKRMENAERRERINARFTAAGL